MYALGAALCCAVVVAPAHPREIAGVEIPEHLRIEPDAPPLSLNGAGVRRKLFFKIYVGALYLPAPARAARAVLAREGPNAVLMHFVYDEVSAQRLASAWEAGFADNHDAAELGRLRRRLERFKARFPTVREGDVVRLEYIPGTGTRVRINGAPRGTIAGADFNRALLRVWLGERPADASLKEAMLGGGR
ncbi:MAG: hypothetical protein GWO02_07980 [Gammaproteobacteria bacterium]|nr:hypothetical protein [Gammaproteobacteria bacterium]